MYVYMYVLIVLQDGDTLLHVAARSGNRDVVALLLNRGADPNLANQVPCHTCTT